MTLRAWFFKLTAPPYRSPILAALQLSLWAELAKLIQKASYEATIGAAFLNSAENGNNRVFLTLLGGGAFGNETAWIIEAIERALTLYRNAALDVSIVSYGSPNQYIRHLIDQIHN